MNLSHSTIRRRLYSLLALQVVVLLLWFCCTALIELQGTVEKNRLQAEQLATRIFNTVDSDMETLGTATTFPIQRDVKGIVNNLYKYLSSQEKLANDRISYANAFEDVAASVLNLNPSVKRLAIANLNGEGLMLSSGSLWASSSQFHLDMTQDWVAEAMARKGAACGPMLLPEGTLGFYEKETCLYQARAVVLAEQYRIAGIAIAGVRLEPIRQMFRTERRYADQQMLLYDSEKNRLDGDLDAAVLSDVSFSASAVSQNCRIAGTRYLVSTIFPENAGFGVSIFTPRDSMLRTIGRYALALCLSVSLLTGLTVVVSAAIVNRIRRPIAALLDAVDAYAAGDFSARAQKTGAQEFDILADALNHMSDEIARLIHDTYAIRLEAKEYQLQVLRGQINPHFLYNALESARMRAYVNGDEEVEKIITSLADMLRYGLATTAAPVTLEEEIRHVREYLRVANACGRRTVTLFVTLEDGCEKCRLPRVTLQPLVENSIKHGFGTGEREETITLYGYRDGDQYSVKLTDNGIGLTEKQLERVRALLETGDSREGTQDRIGLYNVHRRLQLQFGAACGLRVNAVEGSGFSVEMRLPAKDQEEE